MKVLVTGATGFVGKKIVEDLVAAGHQVVTCGRKPLPDLPSYHKVDITSAVSVERLFNEVGRVDCVIHSAGLAHQFQAPKDANIFYRVNVDGTGNVAESAANAGCKKFILISSISVYGDGKPNPCTEDFPCEPSGDYAISKLGGETVAIAVCRARKMPLTILRLATVYGEGDIGNVLRLIKMIDNGKFIWAGKGENGKSLIYNDDVARACRLALENDLAQTAVYNVTDAPHAMKEIVTAIADGLGRKVPSVHLPGGLINMGFKALSFVPLIGGKAGGLSQTLKKWRSDDVLSGEKIKKELGFVTKTKLPEGIAKEIEWYRSVK